MIRLAPSGEQAAYFNSTTVDFVQQWAGATIVTLLAATKFVWVAAGSLTFPFWWPWAQAALKNQALLSKFRCSNVEYTSCDIYTLVHLCNEP